MKSLFTLSFVLLLGVTVLFGQEKTAQSGNILFHAIAKKDVKANAEKFESKIDLSAKKISFIVPVQNFKFKLGLMQKHFNNEENMNSSVHPNATFTGEITANSNIEEEGRHIVSVKGEMTIKGITHPFDANGLLENKNGVTTISASFLVDGTKFGLESAKIKKFVDKVEVSLSATY